MKPQLTFDYAKPDIPEKDFRLFEICNQASRYWIYKQRFYRFKTELLKKKAHFDEYDFQEINKTCGTCAGTGWYYRDSECWNCGGTGIRYTAWYILRRWILNGKVFHEPMGGASSKGTPNDPVLPQLPIYRNRINGYIRHKEPKENPTFAFFQLLMKYDRALFFEVFGSYCSLHQTRAKHRLLTIMRKPISMLNKLSELFKEKPVYDESELPF